MKTSNSRRAQIALVVVLVLALAVPGIALAQPQAKGSRVKAPKAVAKGGFNQPRPQMETRVANVLEARAHRFAATGANIQKRIDRLRSVATSLASEGASATLITKVNGTLDSAQTHLDNALTNEKNVVEPAFKAIPSATNKKAAFFDAREAGRDSVAELKLARKDLRDAVHQLRAIVKAMKATEDDEASGS